MSINKSEWLECNSCPLCKKTSSVIQFGVINDAAYSFGHGTVPIPAGGIPMGRCNECHIQFKMRLPSPDYLSAMFINEAGNVWDVEYNYRREIDEIMRYIAAPFDLLDVGPSNGDLLKNIALLTKRRSGLDIVKHPKVGTHIKGEFIRGLLDSKKLSWSGVPYDVITVFDVFEHFYHPDYAMANLAKLIKQGGYVLIETGDCDSPWVKKYGIELWWYARLFEHHMFWSEEALRKVAKKYGFSVVFFKRKRHKRWHYEKASFVISSTIRSALWRLSPLLFRKIRYYQGKSERQPRSPFVADHLFMIMKKD